jgi:hypothetical protein
MHYSNMIRIILGHVFCKNYALVKTLPKGTFMSVLTNHMMKHIRTIIPLPHWIQLYLNFTHK